MPVKPRFVGKFLRALAANRGVLDRTTLSVQVFNGDYTKQQLSEMCDVAQGLGYIKISKRKTHKKGRPKTRYHLTAAGRELAAIWHLPVKPGRPPQEEVQRLFEEMVSDGDEWAATLDRDAKAWRADQERKKQERAAKAEKEAQKKKEYDERHPQVKNPSAGRHRSEKDLADRALYFGKKMAEQGYEGGADGKYRKIVSSTPVARPVVSRPTYPSQEHGGVMTPARMGPAVPPAVSTQRPLQADDDGGYIFGEKAKLLQKISAAGYQHCIRPNGKVLFNNTELLEPSEWIRRSPGILE
jgi:DNA-binding PadR family transcriptional regulator